MTTLHAMSAADVAREIAALVEQLGEQTGNSNTRQDSAVVDRWAALEDALSHSRAETPADALALLSGILNRADCLMACDYDRGSAMSQLRCIERSALAVARIIERGTSYRLTDFGEFGYLGDTTTASVE